MALIGHRCSCGHNDINHATDADGKRACTAKAGAPCGKRCKTLGDPEVMPTFDRKGNRVERIIPPGEGLPTETGSTGTRTCPCDACQALYEQLAPAA
ncbi:hypothetical protein [Streptomyces sp. NPDC002564]|uniref:hypothetical protein n=1 Tax=Streptomyces sp. NPDC002564 TaxID=3364649 RepID=UPI00367FF0AC